MEQMAQQMERVENGQIQNMLMYILQTLHHLPINSVMEHMKQVVGIVTMRTSFIPTALGSFAGATTTIRMQACSTPTTTTVYRALTTVRVSSSSRRLVPQGNQTGEKAVRPICLLNRNEISNRKRDSYAQSTRP